MFYLSHSTGIFSQSEPPDVCCHGYDTNCSFLPPRSYSKMSNMHNSVLVMTKHALNIIVWCSIMESCSVCISVTCLGQPFWAKMGHFFIDPAHFVQKLDTFLDSQILSGLYHYNTHQMLIHMSNLITILSTEFVIRAPEVCRNEFWIKLAKKWPTLDRFWPKFQNISCLFIFKIQFVCFLT